MPPLTEEEIWMLLNQGNVAANTYGSGPGYLEETKNPYDTLGWREGAISDIFRTAGIYPEDLLGLPEAPEQPAYPEIYQSDVAGLYESNPLFAEFNAAIDRGEDPVTAINTLRVMVNQNPELKQYVPQGVSADDFGGERVYDDWDSFTQTATQIATDRQRTDREMGQYQSEMDAYNRYFQPQSEFELIGSPELEDYIASEYGGYQQATMGRTRGSDPESSRNYRTPKTPQFLQEGDNTSAEISRRFFNIQEQNPGMSDRERDYTRNRINWEDRQMREVETARAANPTWNEPLNLGVASTSNALINSFAQKRLADARGNVLPSQHEQSNRARLQNAYQLLYGETAPVRDPDKGAQPVNKQLASDARKLKKADYKKRSSKR